jgi:hypothetical protein
MFATLVIGAGQAGLAASYYLKHAGLQFAVLEAGVAPTGSWPQYYDSLRLFSLSFPFSQNPLRKTQQVSSLITNVAFYIPLNPLSEPLVYTSPKNSHWWALMRSESKGIEDRVGTFETERRAASYNHWGFARLASTRSTGNWTACGEMW